MTAFSQPKLEHIIAFEFSKTSLAAHFWPEDRQIRIANSATKIKKILRLYSKTTKLTLGLHPNNTAAFRCKSELIQSIKGIGPETATACLAYDPELGTLTKGDAASIVGLAPHAQESGKFRGQRHISGSRKDVWASLYMDMEALLVLRSNPLMRVFAARLKARGKPAKAVIVAGMHKLILNAVLKSGQPTRAPISV